MDTEVSKIDSKGRIVIPNSFRSSLGLRVDEEIIVELDKKNERLVLIPIEKSTRKLEIVFSDAPGTLANVAAILARLKVDLVFTESRSVKRAKEAVWTVVANFSKTDIVKLKADLKKEKSVKKFSFF